MKNENEKQGLFARLAGKKAKQGSCCCNVEVEEIPEDNEKEKGNDTPKSEGKGKPCCK